MTEIDPRITHEDRVNQRRAVAAAMAIAYVGYLGVRDQVDDIVRHDFRQQYLDEGRCMANSGYVGGGIAVSGFLAPGETTVTVNPNAYSKIKFGSLPLVFVVGEEGYVPVNRDAVAVVSVYHCPSGAPEAP